MKLFGSASSKIPSVLTNNGIRPFNWDIDTLFAKLM